MIKTYLPFIQIALSIVLMILILLQQRGTALGSAFGQENSNFYGTLRGAQKKIFWSTIVAGALLIASALANLIV
jgi:protein translocase SecG subunit